MSEAHTPYRARVKADPVPRYSIGTGWFSKPFRNWEWLYPYWMENTYRYAAPVNLFTIASGVGNGDSYLPWQPPRNYVELSGNLGHVNEFDKGIRKGAFCGWSATMLSLAMLAYANDSDFIYKEQDCLAFGPWVNGIYDACKDHLMAFGTCDHYGPATSLFLVKKDLIPAFVSGYMATSTFSSPHPEEKFRFLKNNYPESFTQFTFGYDRDRPKPLEEMAKDDVWYIQQVTKQELAWLKKEGLA